MNGFSRLRAISQIALPFLISACASRSVELVSEPSGLEIQTLGGETLGTTPVILKNEALEKASSSDGLLAVRFVGPGYLPQTLIVEVRGADSYRMQPIKLDDSFFRRYVLRDFSGEHNAMVRDMLNIQGLIRVKKYAEAEQALVAFQERFPTIALSHVMLANLALVKKDKALARRYLLQAQALDSTDPVILRMLGGTPPPPEGDAAAEAAAAASIGAATVLTPPTAAAAGDKAAADGEQRAPAGAGASSAPTASPDALSDTPAGGSQ